MEKEQKINLFTPPFPLSLSLSLLRLCYADDNSLLVFADGLERKSKVNRFSFASFLSFLPSFLPSSLDERGGGGGEREKCSLSPPLPQRQRTIISLEMRRGEGGREAPLE